MLRYIDLRESIVFAPETVLSDWSSDISKLLTLMESTCHLISERTWLTKCKVLGGQVA